MGYFLARCSNFLESMLFFSDTHTVMTRLHKVSAPGRESVQHVRRLKTTTCYFYYVPLHFYSTDLKVVSMFSFNNWRENDLLLNLSVSKLNSELNVSYDAISKYVSCIQKKLLTEIKFALSIISDVYVCM